MTAVDTCGCCTSVAVRPSVHNRPGQQALAYRAATHPAVLHRLLTMLPSRWPQLTTREPDDPALALLDAWAVLADVLSFYQERIANEGFLRTATERRSVLELARMVGYELNPGVAASTHLVFAVENRPPPPGQALLDLHAVVPRGTKVQSVPPQGQLPQTFETRREIVARAEWNELRPRLRRPQPLGLDTRRLYVEGVTAGLTVGDRILIAVPATDRPGAETRVLEVTAVAEDSENGRTRVDMTLAGKPEQAIEPPDPLVPAQLPPARLHFDDQPLSSTFVAQEILGRRWTEHFIRVQRKILHWDVDDLLDAVEALNPFDGGRRKPRRFFDWIDELIPIPVELPPLPQVVEFAPSDGATKVHVLSKIRVRFSQQMIDGTVTRPGAIEVIGPDGVAVPVTVTYDAKERLATVDPYGTSETQGLEPDTWFTVKVKGGPSGILNLLGEQLAVAKQWKFQTGHEAVRPVVKTWVPADTSTDVKVSTEITATFSEALAPASVNATNVQLLEGDPPFPEEDDDPLVSAVVTYDPVTFTVRVRPAKPLKYTSLYSVRLRGDEGGITDTVGNPLQVDNLITFETEDRPPIPPVVPQPTAYAFRERSGVFGHNAPAWGQLADQGMKDDPYTLSWDDENDPRTIWTDSQGDPLEGKVYLERVVRNLEPNSWTLMESPTGISPYWVSAIAEVSRADYAISARSHALELSELDGDSPLKTGFPQFMVRETTAHVRSDPLPLAQLPIDDPLRPGDDKLVLDRMVLDLDKGKPLWLRGQRSDLPVLGDEIVELKEIVHEAGFTTLTFEKGLRYGYIRRTVVLSANVAPATHGETVTPEPLGGGDGGEPNQRFRLHRPPLTYISAPTPSGAESTLEVLVDGVRWDEAPRLYGLGPRDRAYIVRRDDDGGSSSVFGDGRMGARPPTGGENVVARYRTGIGRDGLVRAERLTLMQQRPLGIASVTNPLPAAGAADPESRDAARANAPLAIGVMERIVSVADVADFARAFAGIAKAHAVQLQRGQTTFVHLTVAGEDAAPVPKDSDLHKNLVKAIEKVREPSMTVEVDTFALRYFDAAAQVVLDSAFQAVTVLEAAQRRLEEHFAFERRAFGQPVSAAEVIAVVQAVPGIVAVDLDVLRPTPAEEDPDAPPQVEPQLRARRAHLTATGLVAPAELLLLNPGVTPLTERKA